MKQPQSPEAAAARPRARPLDPVRLEQFLALERTLLGEGDDPAALAGRIALGIVHFLGLDGAAVGLVQDGGYRILAAHGLEPPGVTPADAARRETVLARALASGRPAVPKDPDGRLTLMLPFRIQEATGALHLVPRRDAPLSDGDVALARALALLSGAALAGAEQRRRLRAVARLKGDALAAMAHDLRAPLNAILGYASLLREEAFGPLEPEQRDVCATLERQALELVDLLGATLDVARLETGRLPVRVEAFHLPDVFGALVAGTFAQAAGAGRLTARTPAGLPPLHSDRVKVKEIVQNLVDNALKHAAGAAVELDAALSPTGDAVRITVRDAGPGIPADVLPHLFEPFRPSGGRGTGFGLYIVRCFAEALGGRVAARNQSGAGAAITVELPLRAPTP